MQGIIFVVLLWLNDHFLSLNYASILFYFLNIELFSDLQIECSQMADMAKEIVKTNGFSDGDFLAFYYLFYDSFYSMLISCCDILLTFCFRCSHYGNKRES